LNLNLTKEDENAGEGRGGDRRVGTV